MIENIDVSKNYNQKSSNFFLGADEEACAVHLKEVTCTVDGNRNTFTENRGSALRVESTFFTVFNGASVTFQQNLAHRGGALHFTGNSPGVLVYPNVDLNFIGNKAVIEGGAIYYDPSLEILQPLNNFGLRLLQVAPEILGVSASSLAIFLLPSPITLLLLGALCLGHLWNTVHGR